MAGRAARRRVHSSLAFFFSSFVNAPLIPPPPPLRRRSSVEFDDRLIISGSYDCTARIWDRASGTCLHVLRGHFSRIYSVKYTGQIVLTSSLDATICVWDADTGRRLHVLRGACRLAGRCWHRRSDAPPARQLAPLLPASPSCLSPSKATPPSRD